MQRTPEHQQEKKDNPMKKEKRSKQAFHTNACEM